MIGSATSWGETLPVAMAWSGVGAAPPGAGAPGSTALTFADAAYERLPNGVTIIMKENHSLPIVAVRAYVVAGSAYEPQGRSGLARLTAKTVAMGSGAYPYRDLYDRIEALGSDISVDTDLERAVVSTSVLAAHGEEACKMIASLLVSPAFRGKDFERAKREVLSQISQVEEDATEVGLRKFREVYYAGHPYSHPVAGSGEATRKISLKDVKTFYETAWQPERAVVAVVGDFSADEMGRLLAGLLSGWQTRAGAPRDIPEFQPKPGFQQFVETMPEKKQAKIFWGMQAPGLKDPGFDAFEVMNFIFGGQAFGSRLFDRIREKESLAYVVNTRMDLTSRPGALFIYLGTRPKNVRTAVDATREEMDRITAEGVTDEEMDITRNFLKSLLPFQMQTYSQIATGLTNLRFYDLPRDYYDTYGRRVDRVTKQDVLDAAKTYLRPDNSCLVIVGPIDGNLEPVKPARREPGAAVN
jgi:zinc protease